MKGVEGGGGKETREEGRVRSGVVIREEERKEGERREAEGMSKRRIEQIYLGTPTPWSEGGFLCCLICSPHWSLLGSCLAALGWEGETEITELVVSQRLGAPKIHNFNLSMDAMFLPEKATTLKDLPAGISREPDRVGLSVPLEVRLSLDSRGARNCWISGGVPEPQGMEPCGPG